MPPRRKLNIDQIRASLFTACTACGYKIPPAELREVDGTQIRCPHCNVVFEPPRKPGWGQVGMVEPD